MSPGRSDEQGQRFFCTQRCATASPTQRWGCILAATLPTLVCPVCTKPTPRLLEESSKGAVVNYYRCRCGHIWTVSKRDGSLVSHVTPLPSSRKPSKKP